MRIIVPVLASGLGWWLIWLALGKPNTWPYLAACTVTGPLLMFFWGWTEEWLGYDAVARPEDEVSASTARDPADAGATVRGTDFRSRTGQSHADHQPGHPVIARDHPQPKPRQEAMDAAESHSQAPAGASQ